MLFYLYNSQYLLNGEIPIKLNVSHNSFVFIFLSILAFHDKEGDAFTYNNQGFKFPSINMSNPNKSNHCFLPIIFLFK